MNPPRWRIAAVCVAWVAAIVLAMSLDRSIANFAADHRIPEFLKSTYLAFALKMPGEYFFTLMVAALVVYRKRPRARANGWFLLASGAASVLNGAAKWIAGRARPFRTLGVKEPTDLKPFEFHPGFGGIKGLFGGTPNLAFPSGHATLAFATAAALAILFPRRRWIFFAVATLTAMERFLETAHYFSDTIAAAALGIGVVQLIAWRWAEPFQLPPQRESSTLPPAPLG